MLKSIFKYAFNDFEKKKILIFEMVEVKKFDKTLNCEALVFIDNF